MHYCLSGNHYGKDDFHTHPLYLCCYFETSLTQIDVVFWRLRLKKKLTANTLINYVIRIVEVEAEDFCETMCYMEPDCVSINLDKRVGRNGHYECELNNVTHERHERELEREENYFYHAAEVSDILCNEYGFSKAITIPITFIFHSI